MWYAIHATDNPDSLPARLAARPAHLARLHALRDEGRLLLAGPFPAIDAEDPGPAGFSGSLIVAEFPGLTAAQAWADAHQDEWIPQYAAVLGVPEEMARVLVERDDYAWVPIDDEVIARQQEQADAYTDLGLIQSQLDVSDEFDDSYNDQLAGK